MRRDSACALGEAGDVWCWQKEAARVELPHSAEELDATTRLTCARTQAGIWCWDELHPTPRRVFEDADILRFVPGERSEVCVGGRTLRCKMSSRRPAVLAAERNLPFKPRLLAGGRPCTVKQGRLRCWNRPSPPDGGPNRLRTDPFDVRGLRNLVAHGQQLCGVDRKGHLSCTQPLGTLCEVGMGMRRCRNAEIEAQLDGVDTVSLSADMGCALGRTGEVQCWEERASTPAPAPDPLHTIPLPDAAQSVTVGGSTACAVLKDGSVWCWGASAGPIGHRHRPDRLGWFGLPMPWLDGEG